FCMITTGIFCRNPYNATGICNRSSCPLANSRYATIRDHDGVFYLYMKTAERAHLPNKLWERVKLPKNYKKEFWPKLLVHKIKQWPTKMTQYRIRTRKLQLKVREKIMTMSRKQTQRDLRRLEKAERAAQLERSIENELKERLNKDIYGVYNIPFKKFDDVLDMQRNGVAAEEEEEEEAQMNEDDVLDDPFITVVFILLLHIFGRCCAIFLITILFKTSWMESSMLNVKPADATPVIIVLVMLGIQASGSLMLGGKRVADVKIPGNLSISLEGAFSRFRSLRGRLQGGDWLQHAYTQKMTNLSLSIRLGIQRIIYYILDGIVIGKFIYQYHAKEISTPNAYVNLTSIPDLIEY
ncbi:hypothetical protein ACJX0J_017226, partial [Zea mays]